MLRAASVVLLACLCAQALGLTFTVIGDWGSGRTGQKSVANAMANWANRYRPSFVISVGDNFYEDGVSGNSDPQWSSKWRNVYNQASLKDLTWFNVNGNHDHHKSRGMNEVNYARTNSKWYFPSLYYSFYQYAGSKAIHFIAFDTEKGRTDKSKIAWLEDQLKNSKGDWIIVFAHHPAASSGSHGRSKSVYYNMRPLMNKYKVAFYFSGHDHHLEYLTKPGEPVSYVVSGSGGKTRSTSSSSIADWKRKGFQSHFQRTTYGFVGVSINGDSAQVTFVDQSGRTLYQFTKRNPK